MQLFMVYSIYLYLCALDSANTLFKNNSDIKDLVAVKIYLYQ